MYLISLYISYLKQKLLDLFLLSKCNVCYPLLNQPTNSYTALDILSEIMHKNSLVLFLRKHFLNRHALSLYRSASTLVHVLTRFDISLWEFVFYDADGN